LKIPSAALGERFERALVADPFNEQDGTQVDTCGQPVGPSFDLCQVESLLFAHIPYLHSSRLTLREHEPDTVEGGR
jgi:hypothetical protein